MYKCGQGSVSRDFVPCVISASRRSSGGGDEQEAEGTRDGGHLGTGSSGGCV